MNQYLVRLWQGAYPIGVENLETFFEKHPWAKSVEVARNPKDNPKIQEALSWDLNDERLPDIEKIRDDFMSEYSGRMLSPGIPMIVRGVMDADPEEPPEFDLPDIEEYKETIEERWAKEFLKVATGKDIDICDMSLSDNDRTMSLDMADKMYQHQIGRWPKYNDEIINEYFGFDPYEVYER